MNISVEDKKQLKILNEKEICVETPAHYLDDEITPTNRHFVRNNGGIPDQASRLDASGWSLLIHGEVEHERRFTLDNLKNKFSSVTLRLQLECAGNGRAGFTPQTEGEPWTTGGVACAEWTGIPLADLLSVAKLKPTAIYTGHYGDDAGPNGDPLSRGIPIWKAIEPHTLVAFGMNGKTIPAAHGFPVRLVVPGWAGSVSQKWLNRIWIRDKIHDGAKMMGSSYRMPRYAAAPGVKLPDDDMEIIGSMPVKSLITYPATGSNLAYEENPVEIRGHAWAGDRTVDKVEISYDYGASWMTASLSPPHNVYSWQRWRTWIKFPSKGHYRIWARATDSLGRQQPFMPPGWNSNGYLNNAMHHIELQIGIDW